MGNYLILSIDWWDLLLKVWGGLVVLDFCDCKFAARLLGRQCPFLRSPSPFHPPWPSSPLFVVTSSGVHDTQLTSRIERYTGMKSTLLGYTTTFLHPSSFDITTLLLVYTPRLPSCTYHNLPFIPTRHYALYPGIPHSSCILHFGSGTQICICIYFMLRISRLFHITNWPLDSLLYNSA